MPVRGRPQVPINVSAVPVLPSLCPSSSACMEGVSTVMQPVTSPRPKYCTSTGPSLCNARCWSAWYMGAPA